MIINSLRSFTHFIGDADKSCKIVCCVNGRFNMEWSHVGPNFYHWGCHFIGVKNPIETIEFTKRR